MAREFLNAWATIVFSDLRKVKSYKTILVIQFQTLLIFIMNALPKTIILLVTSCEIGAIVAKLSAKKRN